MAAPESALGRSATLLCGRPEIATAATPPPRPLTVRPPPLPSSPPSLRSPPPAPLLQLPPPNSPGSLADGSRAHPALLGPCALQRRLCELAAALIPTGRVARDAQQPPAAPAPTGPHMCLFFPVPLIPHASAALRRLWLRARPSKGGVATEKSQNQEWRFAAFSGCTPRPVVKLAAWRDELARGVRVCITCALAHHALRLVATTTSSFFSSRAARCAPLPRLLPPSPPSPPRSPCSARARAAASTVCCLYTCPSSGPRAMTLTGSGLRLYARYDWQPGGAAGKWQI
jgi:hypothetical protein